MSHLTKDDYLGLHQRYARLLGDTPQTLSLSKEQKQVRKQLSELFDGMMHTLYSRKVRSSASESKFIF